MVAAVAAALGSSCQQQLSRGSVRARRDPRRGRAWGVAEEPCGAGLRSGHCWFGNRVPGAVVPCVGSASLEDEQTDVVDPTSGHGLVSGEITGAVQ